VEDRRGVIVAAASAVVAAAGTILALVEGDPWLSGLMIAALVLGLIVGIAVLASYCIGWFKDSRSKARPEAETYVSRTPGPPFTVRWRYATDGAQAVSTSWSFSKSVSHPGHSLRQTQETPSKVIVSVLVPCTQLAELPPTSEVVEAFLDLLSGPKIGKLTSMLTHVAGGISWYSFSTNGALNNQAILARAADDPEPPVATAILNLNDTSPKFQHFQDPDRAELLLTIEVRSADGAKPKALSLGQWQVWFVQLLKLPDAFARVLNYEVKTPTFDSLPTHVGVWMESHGDLTDLVDAGAAQSSAGSRPARTFPLYFLADAAGKPAKAVALDALRGVCDYGLHVHGYESQLKELRDQPERSA
jgi:hypothetical protein